MITVNANVDLPEITIFVDHIGIRGLAEFLLQGEEILMKLVDVDRALPRNCVALRSAVILRNDKKLACKKNGDCLQISGDQISVRWLAEYLTDLASNPGFNHIHIEYYDGHPFLDASHTSLVICEI